MLELAKLHEQKLQEAWLRTIDAPYYKYYHISDYVNYNPLTHDSDWQEISYVSTNKNGDIIGHFSVSVGRQSRNLSELYILRFSDSNLFSIDLMRFMDLLLIHRNFRKINFGVVVGNPAEAMYDKFVENYGGRIVGVKKEEAYLSDGQYYDMKSYELFGDSYKKHRKLK